MKPGRHWIAHPSGVDAIVLSLALTFTTASAQGVDNSSLPTSGAGASYATACNNAWQSYNLASSSYISANAQVSTELQTYGGLYTSVLTYYANATTLCDGVARVAQSPAVSLYVSTTTGSQPINGVSTFTMSEWSGGPSVPSPSCSILPSDCDPLWKAYSSSLSQWSQLTATESPAASTTPPPMVPYCINQTEANVQSSIDSAMSACGPCTIFGDGVRLVYFPVPTTVSRDMCASTPAASLTYYGSDAIIEAFAGTNYRGKAPNTDNAPTAVVDQHTFTAGTAYISIATVWAENRCGSSQGAVNNAILAMSSSSVLSLRYSQNHFEYFWLTNTQTGYPVSYADFNTPVPWSAYNGQAQCQGPFIAWPCSVIYEGSYRPQLAIPPGIRQLHPEWATCQMWYGGLYDPPMALQPQQSVAMPTRPPWQHAPPLTGTYSPNPAAITTTIQDDDSMTRPPTPVPVVTTALARTKAAKWTHKPSALTSSTIIVTNIVTVYSSAVGLPEITVGPVPNWSLKPLSSNDRQHSNHDPLQDSRSSDFVGSSETLARNDVTTAVPFSHTPSTLASTLSSGGSGQAPKRHIAFGVGGIFHLLWRANW